MKKFKVLSVILAAAMIVAVAALAASCENNNSNNGVVIDLTTNGETTATTKGQTTAVTSQTTAAEPTSQTTGATEYVPTTATETAATVPTTPTTPTEPTVPTSTTAEATTVPTTTEATTAETPIVTPGVLEYDVKDRDFGTLHVKVENVDPLSRPTYRTNSQWNDVSRVDIRQECDIVVRATVVSIQEVRITVLGVPTYGSVLTLDINRIFYNKSFPEKMRIKVFCELSTHDTTYDAANIYVGGEFFFFLESVEGNSQNRIGYENICEYFISLPPTVDYLLNSRQTLNEKMITLLENNNKSGLFTINSGDSLEFILEDILR